MIKAQEEDREARRAARTDMMSDSTADASMRANGPPSKKIEDFQHEFQGQTQFFTSLCPDEIEKALNDLAIDEKFDVDSDLERYNMKFSYTAHEAKADHGELPDDKTLTKEDNDLEAEMEAMTVKLAVSKVEMRMKISKLPKSEEGNKQPQMYCVEFSKVDGDAFAFQNAYKSLTSRTLKFAIDDLYMPMPAVIA